MGKFINKVRGSVFPEISLDDLAVELFDSSADRSHSVGRSSEVTPTGSTSQRRGKSMSKQVQPPQAAIQLEVDEIEAQLAQKVFKVTACSKFSQIRRSPCF
ncbi:hypothetical protein ACFX15_024522 [Malus domestica]